MKTLGLALILGFALISLPMIAHAGSSFDDDSNFTTSDTSSPDTSETTAFDGGGMTNDQMTASGWAPDTSNEKSWLTSIWDKISGYATSAWNGIASLFKSDSSAQTKTAGNDKKSSDLAALAKATEPLANQPASVTGAKDLSPGEKAFLAQALQNPDATSSATLSGPNMWTDPTTAGTQ